MMPGNPVVGGVALRRPAIQSPNYVKGSTGWAINADGSAEFNSITIPPGSGGNRVFTQGTVPASPNTGDLWINTSAGNEVSVWDGSAWTPYQWGTPAIANGSITAALIAVGIVVAGIIDGTTVNAATFTGSVFEGTDFIINSSGAFWYSSTPAAGNLIASIAAAAGTDGFGNAYSAGINIYGTNVGLLGMEFFGAGGNAAMRMVPNGVPSSIFSDPGIAGYTQNTGPAQYTAVAIESGELASGSGVAEIVAYGGSTDGTTSIPHVSMYGGPSSGLLADFNENGLTLSPATQSWIAVGSRSDTSSITMGNVVSPDDITIQYTIDSVLASGMVYDLTTEFNGTWGNQTLTFYANINGTMTALATIGGAFGSSGASYNGWVRMTVRMISATGCRIHLKGAMVNLALNSGHLLNGSGGNTVAISSTVATGIAIAAGDYIAIAGAWGASATQSLETLGSTLTRSGNP